MSLAAEYGLDEGPQSPPRFDQNTLQLETRGLTRQEHQALFWSKHTVYKNSIAAKLRSIGRQEEAAKLENCHTRYTIAVCQKCRTVERFPNRCDNFFCPECQPRLSNDRRKAVEWWAREIHQPKHVVLTVANVPDLTKFHVTEMRRWFTNLRRSKFCANWKGGFYALEVTNEGRGWHLHIHALVDAKWIDSFALSEAWQRSTNGLGRIVKVRDARGCDYLKEVTKYVVKGVQLAAFKPDDIATFIDSFTGVRTFGVFGSLYGKRTEFAEWFKAIRNAKPLCKCGSCDIRYFDELAFLETDLAPCVESQSLPPPPPERTPLFSARFAVTWPD